jgi:biopolymer transport protein TolQ
MEVANKMDILQILLESGPVVKFVLLVLIFASVLSWAIILKKRKVLKAMVKNNNAFLEIYHNSENLKVVFDEAQELPFSPYRSMFIEGFNELTKIRDVFSKAGKVSGLHGHFKDFGLGVLERGLKKGVNISNMKLNNLLSTLASIGSISPFIGLFGTVWGIINSFTGLANGGGTIDAVAPGIAEALVATAVGLAAAIPAVWFYNYYNSENSKINDEMETFGQDFLNVVERTLVNKM